MTTTQIPQIAGQVRDRLGSRDTARLRTRGQLPAVIYGHKRDPMHICVDAKQVTDLLHHRAHLVEVVLDSTSEPCLIKDVQWDHLGSDILHIDLTRVDVTERVAVRVDLVLTGDPVGLKESGTFLQHPINELDVSCLASQIPDQIKADISGLTPGATFTVADLKLPAGVTVNADPETVIASIQVISEQPESELEPGPTAASEPEVIGKKEPEKNSEG